MKVWTYILTSGNFTINQEDGAQFISIQAGQNSQCLFSGSIPFKGIAPVPISLANGETWTYTTSTPASPLEGIVVTNVSGTVKIQVGF
jgi:hypothetical protein